MSTLSELWDTTRMRLLVELERCESLSKAAQAVGIGQPAASEHLHLLEIAAGQQLAERHGRRLRLTDVGRTLASHAAQALVCLESADEELSALAGLDAGALRLGASPVPGVYLLPEAVSTFISRFPNLEVHLAVSSTKEVFEWVRSGRVQLAVVCESGHDDRVALEPLLDDEIVGVARPGLLRVHDGSVEPDALRGMTLLAREEGSSTREYAVDGLVHLGVGWRRVWELGSIEAIKRAARAGLGVGFLSRHCLREEVRRGELIQFRVAGATPLKGHVSIATLARRPPSPAERRFARTLIDYCSERDEAWNGPTPEGAHENGGPPPNSRPALTHHG